MVTMTSKPVEAVKRAKPKKNGSNVKAFLIVFFDYNGVVHHELLLERRAVNQKKKKTKKDNESRRLHYDNAPDRTSLLVCNFLIKTNTIIMPRTPYSSGLASSDCFHTPKIEKIHEGTEFYAR